MNGFKPIGSGVPVRVAAPLPGAATLARNAVGAVGRVLARAARGQPLLAAETVVQARQAVCAACEHLVVGRCRKCGCFLTAKARLAGERCPLGRWA